MTGKQILGGVLILLCVPLAAAQSGRDELPRLTPQTAPSPDNPQPPESRLRYGPTAPGEGLYAVLTRFRDRSGPHSLRDWGLAVYALNPDSFGGDLDSMRAGSTLIIPAASEVAELAAAGQQALAQGRRPEVATAPPSTAAEADPPPAPAADAPARRSGRLARRSTDPGEAPATPAPISATPAPPDQSDPAATPAPPRDTGRLARRSDQQPEATPAPPQRAAVTQRRRGGQIAAATPRGRQRSTRDERPGDDVSFDPNRRTALAAVDIPPVDPELKPELEPDRWRVVNKLGLIDTPWWDPYNHNTIKGDKPVHGDDWFFQFNLISDSVIEPRRLPIPVGVQTTDRPGSVDVFGEGEQLVLNQNLIFALIYFKGNTTFKPPDYEFRLTPVINYNYVSGDERRVLRIDPGEGTSRTDGQFALQEAFFDYHIRNVSDRYDFDSFRIGLQPFSTDFRGFLFQDIQLGVRFFGTRDNNIFQYNLAWFRRLEKDINSGLNDVTEDLREDDIFVANVYWQDFPSLGFFSQLTAVYNRNREGDEGFFFDTNGFLQRPASIGSERPRNYDVLYLGYNGDGHFGRLNLTVSAYYALGDEEPAVFTDQESDIRAGFFAGEASVDFDWIRLRLSGLYASGDEDPFDDVSQGFDAIFENPIFAGFDTNYWTRQNVPLVAGGGVTVTPRNGQLNSLRSSKEHGQSNFTNPGTVLLGLGADLDLTPEFRLSFNFNKLAFADTSSVEAARNQSDIDTDIGLDLSVAGIYRPFMTQNIVLRLSGAWLEPGDGYKALYPDESGYSVLANFVLTY